MSAPLLRVRGLRKRFGGVRATDGLDLDVAAGEIHALIGPNGAGKSTLIGQLSGALRPDAGSIEFGGVDITREPTPARVARGLARSFQVTSLFPRFTVRENVRLAVQARAGSSFRLWGRAVAETGLNRDTDAVLERVDLTRHADRLACALGHGEQRQLELALALAGRPRLVLLDEPMAGMSPTESAALVRLIGSLKGSAALLLVEHDMDAVFALADRISVLVTGRVIATGAPEAIRSDRAVREAYLGDGP
jgi:branched-chain amino acid transport system ATP-binding protein